MRGKFLNPRKRPSYFEFVSDIFLLSKTKYRYDKESYELPGTSIESVCPVHGQITLQLKSHRKGGICLSCSRENIIKNRLRTTFLKLKNLSTETSWLYLNTFKKANNPVKGYCLIHGEFKILATKVLSRSCACPKCYRDENNHRLPLIELKNLMCSEFTFLGKKTIDSKTYILGVCKEHGVFEKIKQGNKIITCPICARKYAGAENATDPKIFKQRVVEKFGKRFDLSKFQYKSKKTPVTLKCKKCGVTFKITPKALFDKKFRYGCKCNPGRKLEYYEFVADVFLLYGGGLRFDKSTYINKSKRITGHCIKHGEFKAFPISILNNSGACPECAPKVSGSKQQMELFKRIKTLGVKAVYEDREILEGKEIDILLPELNLGIEYNGSVWHSEKFKTDRSDLINHMRQKQLRASIKGIEVVHFNDDIPFDKIINFVKFKAGLVPSVYGRKTVVRDISYSESKSFLDKWHLQGGILQGESKGLFEKETLIGVMVVGPCVSSRGSHGVGLLELRRMAFSKRVVGGASKLFKSYDLEGKNVISFSDNRWFDGGVYKALGFNLVKELAPDYCYVHNGRTYHKANFRKSLLQVKENFIFDWNLTERENCLANGYYQLFDCGKKKWEFNTPPEH